MAEPKRKDNQQELTTADLAGRADIHKPIDKPQLVREPRTQAGEPPETTQTAATQVGAPTATTPLFAERETTDFRSRWSSIQTGFVDEPRRAVEEADKLVASVMKRLAEGFTNERSGLEKQWDRGGDVSTEDLRLALQRYRSFFDRLLNV